MDDKSKHDLSNLLDEKFQGFRKEMQQQFNDFKGEAHQDVKQQFQGFKKEVNQNVQQQFQGFKEEMHQDMVHTFNQGVNEVVMPYLKDIDKNIDDLKGDMKEVKGGLNTVENRLDVVERKLDKVVDNQIDFKNQLGHHEKRLKKMEVSQIAV